MALNLNTSVDEREFYSCDFPDLSITTTNEHIDISVLVNGRSALSTRYYAVNGMVNVRNLVPVIEQTMQQLQNPFCTVSITITDTYETISASCQVLLCKARCMSVDVNTFITSSFLTTNFHRLVTMYEDDVLPFYIPGSDSYAVGAFKYNCLIRKADGTIVQYEWVSGRRLAYGISNAAISASDIHHTCALTYGTDCQLLSFTLTFDTRICHFYVLPCPAAKTFRFTNIFGCSEVVTLPTATVSKLESDYSEAIVDGKLLHYDIKHTRKYEEHTAQLFSGYMSWLEQFLTSSDIRIKLPDGRYADVLIKEYTFELSNAPGEENTLSFTWQFSDGKQTTYRHSIQTGIFTEQYNPAFN